MSGYIEGTDRGQTTLFPERLEGAVICGRLLFCKGFLEQS
mgnify:CR=1 FL=1